MITTSSLEPGYFQYAIIPPSYSLPHTRLPTLWKTSGNSVLLKQKTGFVSGESNGLNDRYVIRGVPILTLGLNSLAPEERL
jgi:hypothetical protein